MVNTPPLTIFAEQILNLFIMSRKKVTELEKFKKACEVIDFTQISVEELNNTLATFQKISEKASIQKKIDELQAKLNELN